MVWNRSQAVHLDYSQLDSIIKSLHEKHKMITFLVLLSVVSNFEVMIINHGQE